MEQLEELFSRDLAGSDIRKINENAGIKPVRVDARTLELIEEALYHANLSEGCFDITIAPLVDSWVYERPCLRTPPG